MSDFNLNLYQCNKGTSIEDQANGLINNLFGKNIAVVVCDNNFILIRSRLTDINNGYLRFIDCFGQYEVKSTEYKLLTDSLLSVRDLMPGKVLVKRNNHKINYELSGKIYEFKKGILRAQLDWIESYAEHLQSSLTERISEGKSIIQQEAVKLSWADLIEHVESLKCVLESYANNKLDVGDKEVSAIVPGLIRKICGCLGKLAGGRAYLSGQAIEMLVLFELFNQTYFFRENKHG